VQLLFLRYKLEGIEFKLLPRVSFLVHHIYFVSYNFFGRQRFMCFLSRLAMMILLFIFCFLVM
jgi:hypothetical protein